MARHYCKAATNTTLGAGCGSGFNSVYGSWADVALAQTALPGNVLRLQGILNGYVGTWENGTAALHYATPPVGAASRATGDDGFVPVTLPSALPRPYGPKSVVAVSGNGIVGFGPTVDTPGTNPWLPTANGFLQSSHGGIYAWHDYNPNEVGSGQIRQHQVGPKVCCTWQDVESYPISIPNRSTLQIQCNLANGDITIVFVAIDGNTSSTFGSGRPRRRDRSRVEIRSGRHRSDNRRHRHGEPRRRAVVADGVEPADRRPELDAAQRRPAADHGLRLHGDLLHRSRHRRPHQHRPARLRRGRVARHPHRVHRAYGAPVHPWSISVPATTAFGLQGGVVNCFLASARPTGPCRQ